MGVTGLWTVVQPCARPIKLETLNRKRLAIDASIWIYQFLKAVRDKEGNALRNSHVVGFFRRICKLLYIGIKPVFVFDGGAPILKRQTITARKQRREGRREDAVRTAGKLLAVQIQRIAEEEGAKRKQPAQSQQEEEVPDEPSYVDEVFMTEKEKSQNRKFRKKDAYHLPELDVSLEAMGGPNDPRIMSQEELEEYARQFYSGEIINLYDFSKIDFDGQFFLSLPVSDRYNILNAARLRSRLRMGYSKEQLDSLFPDRMAFSRFQIERVKERNDLTQRLMNINGMNANSNIGQRIAGERGREYVLVKDNDVEGGWALGVVSNRDAGQRDKPIDVDEYGQEEVNPEREDEWESDGDTFEDVPIEGVNRLPRLPVFQNGIFDESIEQHTRAMAEKRKVVEPQRQAVERQVSRDRFAKDDSLFVEGQLGSMQSSPAARSAGDSIELEVASEDEDLLRAIEISLDSPKDDIFEDVSSVNDLRMTDHASPSQSQSDDNDMDFAMALARSKRPQEGLKSTKSGSENLFSGPLPFETLRPRKDPNKKIAPKVDAQEDNGGSGKRAPVVSKQTSRPLPPWFTSGGESKKDFIVDDTSGMSLKRDRNPELTHSYTFPGFQESPDVIYIDTMSKPENIVELEHEGVPSSPAGPRKQAGKLSSLVSEIADSRIMEPSVSAVSNTNRERDVPKNLSTADSMSEDEQIYEWEQTDVEDSASISELGKKPVSQGSPLGRETTFSHEFEDVEMQPPSKAPEAFPDAGVNSTLQPVINQESLVEYEAGFSDPEDEDLVRQLAAEAEEHARFASTFNNKTPAENALDFEQQLKQLRAQQKKDRRDADEVSQVMISECQQLLRLFGLPYITAPMEAEAQCAELVSLGLVDGIVTDDSDIFLFGGTRVYKNMFNQSKFVECYLANDLEKEYALDRPKLIRFAHLLGSDYTEGIPGVGPVTALEIVTEFGRLEDFRDWWTQAQMGTEIPNDTHSAFRKKFRKNVTKLFLPPSFPDTRVDTAYLQPEVDSDPSSFQWGVPDLIGLRGFLMSTVGWSQERTDEVLVPVIRDMNQREQEGTQANITNFISGNQGAGAFAPRLATEGKGRLGKAFNRLRQEAETRKRATNANSDGAEQALGTDDDQHDSQPSRKRRKGPADKKKKKKNTRAK